MRKILLFVTAVTIGLAALASAQNVAELEQKLPSATGLERGRILAQLTDLLRQDNPKRAIEYGQQALQHFVTYPDPASNVKTLSEMAWAYMTLSDYEKAVALAEQGRVLAEKVRDDRGRARAINNLGVIAQRRGDAPEAVEQFEKALGIYRTLGNDLDISMELNNLGFVYSTDLADYESGLRYHVEALAVREKLGDKSAIALSLNNIGIIYQRVGEIDRALKYYERALELRKELGVQNRIAGTLNNIGDAWFDKGDYQKALDFHTQALDLRRQTSDRAGIALSLKNLALANTKIGRTDLARTQLTEALALTATDRTVAAQVHLGLAALDRVKGTASSAIAHARRALELAAESGSLEVERLAWEELSASEERAGDDAGALAAFRHFKELSDRAYDAERSRRVEVLERRYQAERREAEIQQLRAEQAVTALNLNQQKFQRNAIVAGGLVLALVAYLLYRRRVEAAEIAHRLSVTDALTGLRNRRYVTQTIEADTGVSARRYRMAAPGTIPPESDLVFLVVDVDHFKSVNDQHGHSAGDRVLCQMAEVLRGAIRSSDTLARWGGEEFLVICRFTNRDQAAISAERIRQAVANRLFDLGGGQTISRTCSIGFASYPFSRTQPDALTWEQVIVLADHALYLAKQADRNAWVGVLEGPSVGDPSGIVPGNLRVLAEADRVRLESSRPLFDVRADGFQLVPGIAGGGFGGPGSA